MKSKRTEANKSNQNETRQATKLNKQTPGKGPTEHIAVHREGDRYSFDDDVHQRRVES